MTLQARIEAAVAQLETDTALLRQIVQGDDQTVVTTESGPVDSAAKAIAAVQADVALILDNLLAIQSAPAAAAAASAYSDRAQAWAEEVEDTEVSPGQFSALHWAQKALGAAGGAGIPAFHGLTVIDGALEWTTGDPFDASAVDEWLILPVSAVFTLTPDGYLEVTF